MADTDTAARRQRGRWFRRFSRAGRMLNPVGLGTVGFLVVLLVSNCLGGHKEMAGIAGATVSQPASQEPTIEPTSAVVTEPSPVPSFTPMPYLRVPVDYPTIQAAIDAAQDGDLVVVSPGTYVENLDFQGKNITVRSGDPQSAEVVAATILDGGGRGSVVTFEGGETTAAILSGFTITNGSGSIYLRSSAQSKGDARQFCNEGVFGSPEEQRICGGGIVVHGSSPTIEGNVISGNKATHGGGGIFVRSESSPIISNNQITDNEAGGGGGVFVTDHSSPTIEGNTIGNNRAENGGGILVDWGSAPTIRDNTVEDNRSQLAGGILVFNHSSAAITHNTITENKATGGGGGGIFVGAASDLTLEGNEFSGNEGAFGGAIFAELSSSLKVRDNTFTQNVTGSFGGAIDLSSGCSAEILDNVFRANVGRYGGGLCVTGSAFVTLSGNVFAGNEGEYGGGIYVKEDAIAIAVGNDFQGNRAEEQGGAIWASLNSKLVLRDPDDNRYQANQPDDIYRAPD
jgi:parallel beta-helix repeat protein